MKQIVTIAAMLMSLVGSIASAEVTLISANSIGQDQDGTSELNRNGYDKDIQKMNNASDSIASSLFSRKPASDTGKGSSRDGLSVTLIKVSR